MEWKRKSSGVSQAGVPNELINISSNNIVRYVKYLRFLFMFFCDHKSLLNEYKKKTLNGSKGEAYRYPILWDAGVQRGSMLTFVSL